MPDAAITQTYGESAAERSLALLCEHVLAVVQRALAAGRDQVPLADLAELTPVISQANAMYFEGRAHMQPGVGVMRLSFRATQAEILRLLDALDARGESLAVMRISISRGALNELAGGIADGRPLNDVEEPFGLVDSLEADHIGPI